MKNISMKNHQKKEAKFILFHFSTIFQSFPHFACYYLNTHF